MFLSPTELATLTSLTAAKEAAGIDYAKTLAGHASARMTESYIAQRSVTKVRPIR